MPLLKRLFLPVTFAALMALTWHGAWIFLKLVVLGVPWPQDARRRCLDVQLSLYVAVNVLNLLRLRSLRRRGTAVAGPEPLPQPQLIAALAMMPLAVGTLINVFRDAHPILWPFAITAVLWLVAAVMEQWQAGNPAAD